MVGGDFKGGQDTEGQNETEREGRCDQEGSIKTQTTTDYETFCCGSPLVYYKTDFKNHQNKTKNISLKQFKLKLKYKFKDIETTIRTLGRKERSLREHQPKIISCHSWAVDGNRRGQMSIPGERGPEFWCHK